MAAKKEDETKKLPEKETKELLGMPKEEAKRGASKKPASDDR